MELFAIKFKNCNLSQYAPPWVLQGTYIDLGPGLKRDDRIPLLHQAFLTLFLKPGLVVFAY